MSKENYRYTVAELIEKLKLFPDDLPVLVSGYEGGFENITLPKVERLKNYPEKKYWDGEFQTIVNEDKDSFEAVILERVVRDV